MPALLEARLLLLEEIIVSTERDATFTLDEILGNTTELPRLEHTTDSHGQTLATFAMFDLSL